MRQMKNFGLQEAHLMFNVIILCGLFSLLGIGAGYLILSAFFAGVQHIAKPRSLDFEKTTQENIDN